MKIVVDILYFEGCPGLDAAVRSVTSAAAAIGADVDVRSVAIDGDDAARGARFLGSPSVRIFGRDVEAGAEARTDFGIKCRIYDVDGRMTNAPPAAWIERALAATIQEAPWDSR